MGDEKGKQFESMEEDQQDLWLAQENLLDGNDANSIFYDDFPPLPDFPCMSSSSSSSSTPKPPAAAAASSSTATSVNFRQMKVEPSTPYVECTDVMENFEYMDLIDTDEIWDPSSLFQEPQQQTPLEEEDEGGFGGFLEGNSELAAIFLEWLKQNRDYISAEDMRTIKLKRSTIDSAYKRLGHTKEGLKQLLKLILQWVQQHHLHRKRLSEAVQITHPNPNFVFNLPTPPSPFPYPNHQIPYPNSGGGSSTQPWAGLSSPPYHHHHQQITHYNIPPPPPPPSPSPYQIFDDGNGNRERMMRLGPSATKEARKKRMARQHRRLFTHPRHSTSTNTNQHHNHLNDPFLLGEIGGQDEVPPTAADNWMCWSPGAGASATPQPNPYSGDQTPTLAAAAADRKHQQGWRGEKNLKFLLQKVLKQSDVGSLGRIVLPKREAESHLPELETRDGITISMEDIGSSRVWNMRYRFWPNNKSRMYLLENTGDFVRTHGLQEGDFIVIYSDTKCGKYMIRGVKVRQPAGVKLESKKPARRNNRNVSLAGNSSSHEPIK